jgi:hypothetical protein
MRKDVKDGSSRNKIKYPSCSNLGPKINSRSREWNLELCIMPRCSIEMLEMIEEMLEMIEEMLEMCSKMIETDSILKLCCY